MSSHACIIVMIYLGWFTCLLHLPCKLGEPRPNGPQILALIIIVRHQAPFFILQVTCSIKSLRCQTDLHPSNSNSIPLLDHDLSSLKLSQEQIYLNCYQFWEGYESKWWGSPWPPTQPFRQFPVFDTTTQHHVTQPGLRGFISRQTCHPF